MNFMVAEGISHNRFLAKLILKSNHPVHPIRDMDDFSARFDGPLLLGQMSSNARWHRWWGWAPQGNHRSHGLLGPVSLFSLFLMNICTYNISIYIYNSKNNNNNSNNNSNFNNDNNNDNNDNNDNDNNDNNNIYYTHITAFCIHITYLLNISTWFLTCQARVFKFQQVQLLLFLFSRLLLLLFPPSLPPSPVFFFSPGALFLQLVVTVWFNCCSIVVCHIASSGCSGPRLDPNTCQTGQIECQTECQHTCQIECLKDCQIEWCQNICQIECQKECQNRLDVR